MKIMELRNYNSAVYHGLCISLMFTWNCSTDNASTLEPILAHRNDLYRHWVGSGSHADHGAFATARGESRFAVRVANDCAWSASREIQGCFSGLRPSPSSTVLDEDCNVCVLVEAQRDR